MKLAIYQVDAFAEKQFEGNPAAVVPLEAWLPDATMQAIAEENNLAETAFFVPTEKGFHIRWFTPTSEVKLCGHATLASAHVLFNALNYQHDVISFASLSGELLVSKTDQLLTLDFPTQAPENCATPSELITGLGITPAACLKHDDYIAVFEDEADVLNIRPDHTALNELDLRGVIATAPSEEFDFVVRFFGPKVGIPEDPVTGSAFTQAVPYWSDRLNKLVLHAKQVSSRGGKLLCEHRGDRVLISGSAITYLEGKIEISS
ncbi:MAG: PhzF family phenazine biosynthesis protein [Pseudomonadota bacterium]